MKYVVGVDGGTESIRAGVFDLEGKPLAFAAAPYSTGHPHPGWAEQDPKDWFAGLGIAVRDAIKASGLRAEDCAAICLDTTCCTVVALDGKGDALCPALLWMDMRSAKQAAEVGACGDDALKVNSGGAGPVSAEWMIPKALWLKQNRPDVYDAAVTICEYQDYMNYHLTGNMVASINNASIRWHYNSTTGWPSSMLARLGIPDLQDKWPKKVLPLGAHVGGLTSRAAAHLGLPEGLIVAQGGADAFIGMIGLGALEPGQMALLTGSSHLHLGVTDRTFHSKGVWGTYPDAVFPGTSIVEGGQTSTGSAINWFKKMLPPDLSYDELNKAAAALPEGCEGLLCLDHFQGNRTPHTDPLSRGAITGLTLKHSPAHIFRGIIEGIAFGTEDIFDSMREGGYTPSSIAIAGGATRSELWLRIHADVSNTPLRLTRVADAPALGAAILAAVAAGLYTDMRAAAAAMVHVEREIKPDAAAHARYMQVYPSYKKLYPALRETAHAAGGTSAPSSSKPAGSRVCSGGRRAIIAPSLLAADFGRLAEEAARVAGGGAEWLHVDVFDGHFCANLSMGPQVVSSLRKHSNIFLDCHLSVANPAQWVAPFAEAGASGITFHVEAVQDYAAAASLAADIRAHGMRAGLALSPDTGITPVVEQLCSNKDVDMVLVMSVRPGFGGQKFIPEVCEKASALHAKFPQLDLQMDGGLSMESGTVAQAAAAGVNIIVAGTAVFKPGVNSASVIGSMLDVLSSIESD